jgi:hypothetical protein
MGGTRNGKTVCVVCALVISAADTEYELGHGARPALRASTVFHALAGGVGLEPYAEVIEPEGRPLEGGPSPSGGCRAYRQPPGALSVPL